MEKKKKLKAAIAQRAMQVMSVRAMKTNVVVGFQERINETLSKDLGIERCGLIQSIVFVYWHQNSFHCNQQIDTYLLK